MEDENAEAESTEEEELITKVRWAIPQRLDAVSFVGRDVLALAHELYIVFVNLRTGAELVYTADGHERGDGVDVVAGYKSNMFAFAEKVKHARIFIVIYPSFNILTELKDNDVNRYKGLCLMENDLVAGFSGFPNYLVSVWSWRSGQRLLSLPTGVVRRRQVFMASRVHTLICECWGEGLHVWEVALCFKRCLVMRRSKQEARGWEVASSPLKAVCWTLDGELYAIDEHAHLYGVTSDGINMKTNLEWCDDIEGKNTPCMCAFGNGILVSGPDDNIRWLRKAEQKWTVSWMGAVCAGDALVQLVANASAEGAAAWSRAGRLLRLTPRHDDHNAVEVTLVAFKQRNIKRIQIIAPDYEYLATLSDDGVMCIYEIESARLVDVTYFKGEDVTIKASPTEPLLAVVGAGGLLVRLSEGGEACLNYGLVLMAWRPTAARGLHKVASVCLTHQIVSRIAFSPTGRELVAAAMAAGHVFIFKLSEEYTLTLMRYAELGRGLADCFLMKVGAQMRAICLVLFSDKYAIGERIVCINAETGKDNKFAGKMQGPYGKLLPLSEKDTMLAIPHLSKQFHVLKLSGDKGVTVSVKMGPIVESGHELRQFSGFRSAAAGPLLTFGADGTVILRAPDGGPHYDARLVMSHRYEGGIWQAAIDARCRVLACLTRTRTLVVAARAPAYDANGPAPPAPPAPAADLLDPALHAVSIVDDGDKNYLDLQEEKKVREEALDYKKQRDEVVSTFMVLQARLVELLEENIAERPLHQLSLAEFNLHLENKKERLKAAEREREEIRLTTEARIRAQDRVTAWIKAYCWDTMLTPRVKLFALFSHYQVENYPVLPTQRDQWPELQQTAALRVLEMENDRDLFRPWEELDAPAPPAAQQREAGVAGGGGAGESALSMGEGREARESSGAVGAGGGAGAGEAEEMGSPYVLSGTNTHNFIAVQPYAIPQTLANSYLQMNFLCHITKFNVQNMRLWFNKQFDELMTAKKREVGLVAERNARLRFIIEELNKLSDLRGSFHHLIIEIKDPEWRQEEEPIKLIKVEPEECAIPPYISPSQIVIVPPDPGPKDDFRERALVEMMDGVLEKLWHEEIKKPIPMPQCMLDKEPEHWNEEDLKQVFDYEAKVAFRDEERSKYRKMLHAEYAKLSQVLNEGVVKFNMRVKDMWLMKLRVDSVIGQENLNLMRLRRTNLDRVEAAERLEDMRSSIVVLEAEVEALAAELARVQAQGGECQGAYDALAARDRAMDRTFKNNFADVSSIVSDQCYKFFKRRPKWHQRAAMTPGVLNELAACVLALQRTPLLHPDCIDYFKGVEQLDQLSNMPPVMDEALWTTMCRLRRAKIENEIRMRALVLETSYVEAAAGAWARAVQARRSRLALAAQGIARHRDSEGLTAINRTIQLVLPAGQVEIVTTGHMQDFEDSSLVPRADIEKINNLILKVGAIKLRMMRKQMEFRKGILAKEWEHAQMKMKLRHMNQELYSYQRLKIPKELQWYLKNKEKGYTDEMDYMRLEKELEASRVSFSRLLADHVHRAEELEVRVNKVSAQSAALDQLVLALTVRVSEKRIHEDPLEPIRVRRSLKKRMDTLVVRSNLIRQVQANHTAIVVLQTELELLRLKTYPTLASFRTIC